MGEILGVGLSHYPPLGGPDENMSGLLRWTLQDPGIPAVEKDPSHWPPRMRAEWSDDRGTQAAAAHRASLVAQFDRVRRDIEAFRPDFMVIWGDDQYENFREDVIPPYTVCAYPDMDVFPWRNAEESSAMKGKPNVWGEDQAARFRIRGRPDVARHLVGGLLERGLDVAWAYTPLHHPGLPHAFVNAILYLDYHRTGFDFPVIAFPLNCYGRRVVSCRGFMTRIGDPVEFDPPSPPPSRFMELGRATAEVFSEGPWRVVLMASSSWSHAFLCDRTYRLRPDTPADLRLYDALERSDFDTWRSTRLTQLEDAGQQEMLNWFPLMGAMERLGARLGWSEWVGTDVFNSNKVFAVYDPV